MDNIELIDWYKRLIYIRLVEEEIAKRYSEQEMRCPVHLSIGQEAVPVGVARVLGKNDHFFQESQVFMNICKEVIEI